MVHYFLDLHTSLTVQNIEVWQLISEYANRNTPSAKLFNFVDKGFGAWCK